MTVLALHSKELLYYILLNDLLSLQINKYPWLVRLVDRVAYDEDPEAYEAKHGECGGTLVASRQTCERCLTRPRPFLSNNKRNRESCY